MNKLQDFMERIYQEHAEYFKRHYPNCQPEGVKAIDGKKYIKVDVGSSGKFMIVKETGVIHGIKAYGVIHPKKTYGTLDTIDQYYWGDYSPVKKVTR